jgi:hypothetical protein
LFVLGGLCENEFPLWPVDVTAMPLNEDEQRILQEIEAQFYATDPQLAQQVSETTLYRHAARNIKWAALGFVAGFIVLVLFFANSLPLGFAGFLGMLACAFVIERNVRKLGRAGLDSLTSSMKGNRLKRVFGDAGRNLKRPFRRDDG